MSENNKSQMIKAGKTVVILGILAGLVQANGPKNVFSFVFQILRLGGREGYNFARRLMQWTKESGSEALSFLHDKLSQVAFVLGIWFQISCLVIAFFLGFMFWGISVGTDGDLGFARKIILITGALTVIYFYACVKFTISTVAILADVYEFGKKTAVELAKIPAPILKLVKLDISNLTKVTVEESDIRNSLKGLFYIPFIFAIWTTAFVIYPNWLCYYIALGAVVSVFGLSAGKNILGWKKEVFLPIIVVAFALLIVVGFFLFTGGALVNQVAPEKKQQYAQKIKSKTARVVDSVVIWGTGEKKEEIKIVLTEPLVISGDLPKPVKEKPVRHASTSRSSSTRVANTNKTPPKVSKDSGLSVMEQIVLDAYEKMEKQNR